MRARTSSERDAYTQGFRAGCEEAAREARKRNFSEAAEFIDAMLDSYLILMGVYEDPNAPKPHC